MRAPPPRVTRAAPMLVWGCVFSLWTFATWGLEGRILTLLRPEATLDRVAYVVIANLVVGVLGAALLVRHSGVPDDVASASPRRVAVSVAIGFAIGLGFFLLQDPAPGQTWVVVNAFAQVLTVTVAEVAVCFWALRAALRAWRPRGRRLAAVATVLVGAPMFGVYHLAHSPPFDTWSMVALLTAVGLVSGVFFVVAREIYGAIVLHNFAGTIGVVQALRASGRAAAYEEPRAVTLLLALGSIAVLIALDVWASTSGGRALASRGIAPNANGRQASD